MATKQHGYIRALNCETGTVYEIRPDMLRVQGHHWKVLDEEYMNLPGAEMNQGPDTVAVDNKAERVKVKRKEEVKVIMTSKGKPFASENAARSAMTRKGLSENEWIVLPNGNDGFVISKV